MPRQLFALVAVSVFLSLPKGATAQEKYDQFVGEWVASLQIARSCPGMTTYDQQGAAEIARSQNKLRKQKVLRLLFYSKTELLEQQGNIALSKRKLDPSNKQSLCRFGRSVAGKNDSIGRFLRTN